MKIVLKPFAYCFLLVLSLGGASFFVSGQQSGPAGQINPAERYAKSEYQIPMRDGVKLHTVVYAPKDATTTYPF
ncbi:MAG: hypothetical protein IPL01_03615 [Acidobacteria bacterium]|nr:hypothetical protein [Acidobacteriota bacterium]